MGREELEKNLQAEKLAERCPIPISLVLKRVSSKPAQVKKSSKKLLEYLSTISAAETGQIEASVCKDDP